MAGSIGTLTAPGTSEWLDWVGGECSIWIGASDKHAVPHYNFGGNTVAIQVADAPVEDAARALTDGGGGAIEATEKAVVGVSISACKIRYVVSGGGACDINVRVDAVDKKR